VNSVAKKISQTEAEMEAANGTGNGEEENSASSSSPVISTVVPCTLLPGENVSQIGKTREKNSIVLTNYRLHVDQESTNESGSRLGFINVPLSCIESVEAKDLFFVLINCKDGKSYRISFGDNSTCEDWHQRLLLSFNVQNIEDSFAFIHHQWALDAQFEELEDDLLALAATDSSCDTFRHEVTRLGFDLSGSWRISSINKELTFCHTYPAEILVPACISDQTLDKVASFRSAKRVPAVVWRHIHTGAVLARCSQPEVGWLGWRSAEDEDLIKAIADASAYDHPGAVKTDISINSDEDRSSEVNGVGSADGVPSLKDLSAEVAAAVGNTSKVLIVDARSYPAAVGNRARGGGVECIEYYPFAEIVFMSLGNIHNIRKSFQALRVLCNQTPSDTLGARWLAALDDTKWLYHTSGLLKAASKVASALHNEARPVLVHCSDGWDRTPQIVSLAQLMLDPYYRTIDGFRTLCEVCWLDFGHKMADRNGTVGGGTDSNERAPIFLQWLDCVHQLLLQFPCNFEFNLSFLVKLAQHTYSSMFGTFLCNTLLERRRNTVSEKTRSVWDYLEHHHVKFRNFLFETRLTKEAVDPLWPRCEVRDLLLWKDVYVVADVSNSGNGNGGSSGNTRSNGSCNSASTASSSGLNSRCEDVPSTDAVDSSSREDDGLHPNDCNGSGPPKSENLKKVHDELERLERSGSFSSQGNGSTAAVAPEGAEEAPAALTQNLSNPSSSISARLGQRAAIESSTDTLVDSSRCQTSTNAAEVQVANSTPLCDPAIKSKIPTENGGFGGGGSIGCPSNYASNCLMGCDLNQYFKEPIDTDGLTAHHNQVQERLVRIFASHQAEVQALRRDLQCTRVALFKHKSLLSSSRGCNGSVNAALACNSDHEILQGDIEIGKEAKAGHNGATHGPTHNSGSSSTGACSDASSTWEAVDEKEANPTLWVPDHAVAACMKCSTNFWFGRRKHHCRNCGFLFCRDCSSRMIPIPSEQLYHPVRVCDDCFIILDAKQKLNHWTTEGEDDKTETDETKQEAVAQQTDKDHGSISGQQTPPPPP